VQEFAKQKRRKFNEYFKQALARVMSLEDAPSSEGCAGDPAVLNPPPRSEAEPSPISAVSMFKTPISDASAASAGGVPESPLHALSFSAMSALPGSGSGGGGGQLEPEAPSPPDGAAGGDQMDTDGEGGTTGDAVEQPPAEQGEHGGEGHSGQVGVQLELQVRRAGVAQRGDERLYDPSGAPLARALQQRPLLSVPHVRSAVLRSHRRRC
jgi:hypothetical protein